MKIDPRKSIVDLVLSPCHRRDLILAQITADASLCPNTMSEYFSAPRAAPLGQPPPSSEIHADPSQQNDEISSLSQFQFPHHETEEQKTQEQHHDQVSTSDIAAPSAAVAISFLQVAFSRYLIGFSTLGQDGSSKPLTVYSPSADSHRNNRRTLYHSCDRTIRPSPDV